MSVLIKGMKMPQNCAECPMLYGGDSCYLSKMFSGGDFLLFCFNGHSNEYRLCEFPYIEKRVDWCPLIELPDHGDLIDRDEQIERAWRLKLDTRELIAEILNTAPMVIPAERSE